MAMTKKERAAVDSEIARLKTLHALRWTEPVKPDVPPPSGRIGDVTVTEGYLAHLGSYGPVSVDLMWSTSTAHGRGGIEEGSKKYRPGTQGRVALHSTKIGALKALRHKVELECADRLRAIDAAIEREIESEPAQA